MTELLRFAWAEPAAPTAARVVLVQDGRALAPPALTAAERRVLAAWLKSSKFEGTAGETAWPPGLSAPVLLAGLGPKPEFHAARWFRAWAGVGRALALSPALGRVSFEWPEKSEFSAETAALAGLAAAAVLVAQSRPQSPSRSTCRPASTPCSGPTRARACGPRSRRCVRAPG